MANEPPYKVTIYVAAPGTPLREGGTSLTGHVYLSTEHGKVFDSYGFAPEAHGSATGPGKVFKEDFDNYIKPYYARTLEITKEQYDKIREFANAPAAHGFNMQYGGFSNSCIDFTWGALNHAGLHRVTPKGIEPAYDGAVRPLQNKKEIESIQAPFPHSKWNTETPNPMPKRTFGQWLISDADARGTPLDPSHQDNSLLEQISSKVAKLDADHGRDFDQTSQCISASLLCLAKDNGMKSVDHVLLSAATAEQPAARNIFIVQGDLRDPSHVRAVMPTALAAETPVEASFERLERVAQETQQTTRSHALAQDMQDQVQTQEAVARRMG